MALFLIIIRGIIMAVKAKMKPRYKLNIPNILPINKAVNKIDEMAVVIQTIHFNNKAIQDFSLSRLNLQHRQLIPNTQSIIAKKALFPKISVKSAITMKMIKNVIVMVRIQFPPKKLKVRIILLFILARPLILVKSLNKNPWSTRIDDRGCVC